MATNDNATKLNTANALIAADGNCPQIKTLLDKAIHPVAWIPIGCNPLEAIGKTLEAEKPETLHLVAHGDTGKLKIGGEWISTDDLLTHAEQLKQWKAKNIALWSCNLGRDERFIAVLEELTGAHVFATNSTINSRQNILKSARNNQELEAESFIEPEAFKAWPHSLGIVAFTPGQVYQLSNVTQSKITPSQLITDAIVSQADPVVGEPAANQLFTKTSGNNLLVNITVNGTTITGDIQRRVTSGSNLEGLVFFEDVDKDGNVPEGGEGGVAYLIVNTGSEASFQVGTQESTNSANPDQLTSDLNALLANDGGNQASTLAPEASITSVSVSENSPFAVVEFTLSAASANPISFTPTVADGTGTAGGVDAGSATGSGLEFFDSSSNAWLPVTSSVTLAPGTTSVLLRTPIIDDGTAEGTETVLIQSGAITGGVLNSGGVSSTVSIVDDGTEANTFDSSNNTAIPSQGTADNDFGSTPLISVSSITVSEASQQAVVKVSLSSAAAVNVTFTPSLVNGTAIAGADTGAGIEFFNGTSWTSAAGGVTIPTGSSSILLRTSVVNDTIFENSESLGITTGTVSSGVFNTSGASGTITILDNGTTTNSFDTTNTTSTPTSTTSSDNDTPSISVSDITVSESSPFAVVKASLSNPSSETIQFIPSLTSGSATVGTDTGSTIEFFNGSSWVSAASGATIPASTTEVLLRVAISNDTTLESLSSGLENLSISTGNILAGTISNPTGASGTITISDNGSTTNTFLATNNSATPTIGTADNDTPTLNVGSITVSESSPFAVVPINLSNASNGPITLNLALSQSGSALEQATIGVDTGSSLEFFNGTTWQAVSNGTLSTNSLTIPSGETQLLVRLAIVNDLAFEGLESLHLTASSVSGASLGTSTGRITIADNGTSSNIFLATNNTATPDAATNVVAAGINAQDNDLFCPTPTPDVALTIGSSGSLGTDASLTQPITSSIITGGQSQAISISSRLVSLLNGQVTVGNSLTSTANETGNLSASASAVTAPTVNPFTAEPTFDGKIYTRTDATGLALNNGDRLLIAGAVRYVVNANPASPTPGSSSNIGDTFQLAAEPVGEPLFDSAAPQPGNGTFVDSTRNGVNSFVGCACETGGLIDTNSATDIDLTVGTDSSVDVNVLNVLRATSSGVTADTTSTSNSPSGGFFGLSNTGVQTGNNGSLFVDLFTSSRSSSSTVTGQSSADANNSNSIGIRDIGAANSVFSFGGSGTLTTRLAGTAQASISNVAVSEGSNASVTFQLSQAYPKTVNFTPSLANGTGTASSDAGPTIEASFDNGNTWLNASSGVSLGPGVTSVQLRTSIINDSSTESTETILIQSGTLTDGSGAVLSSSGATGVITIVDIGQALPSPVSTGSSSTSLLSVPVTTEANASTVTGNSSATSNQETIAAILDRTSGEAGIGSSAVANQLQFGNQATLTSTVLNSNRASASSVTGFSRANANTTNGVLGIAVDRVQVGEGAAINSDVNTTTASTSNSVTGNADSVTQAGRIQAFVLDELSIGSSTSTNTPSSVNVASAGNLSATAGTITGTARASSTPTKVTALSIGEGLPVGSTALLLGNGGSLTGSSQITQNANASAVTGAASSAVSTPAIKGLELFTAGLLGNGGTVNGQANLTQGSRAELINGAATSTNTALIVGTESPSLNFGTSSGNSLGGQASGTLNSNSSTVTGPANASLQTTAVGINGVGSNTSLAVGGTVSSFANISQTVTARAVTGSAIASGFGDVIGIQNSQLNLVGDGSLQATVSLSSSS